MTTSLDGRLLFETERTRVRRLTPTDAVALLSVYGERELMVWVADGEPLDREACESWLAVTKSNYERRGYGMFLVESRATGELMGFVGIVHPGNQVEAEVKYALLQPQWGQGLATEIVCATVAYGLETLGLAELISTVDEGHLASRRVLEKAGFVEGEPRREDDGSLTLVYRRSAA